MRIIKKYLNPSGKLMKVDVDDDFVSNLSSYYLPSSEDDRLDILLDYLNFPVIAGELPEVEVKFNDRDKKTLENIRKIFIKPLREDLRRMYNENYDAGWGTIPMNDFLDNVVDMHKLGGDPGINSPKLYSKWFKGKGVPRAFYVNIPNTMHNINDIEDYFAELAHAIQYKNGKYRRKYTSLLSAPSDLKLFGNKNGYERTGHIEYNAHNIIEPAMYDYIFIHSNDIPGRNEDFEYYLKKYNRISKDEADYELDELRKSDEYKNSNLLNKILRNLEYRSFELDENDYPIWKTTL